MIHIYYSLHRIYVYILVIDLIGECPHVITHCNLPAVTE